MKVALIADEYLPVPPVMGGPIPEILYETALGVEGFTLTVISPWMDALKGLEVPQGVFFHVDKAAEGARVQRLLGRSVSTHNRHAINWLHYLQGVIRLLKSLNPDVIEVHNRPAFVPCLRRRFPDAQVVLCMHNEPSGIDILVEEALDAVDRLVVVSHFLARCYAERYPVCASKVSVIHNSVNTDVWHPGLKDEAETARVREIYRLQAGRTVLFVGRVHPNKGVAYLIDAMTQVQRRVPDAKLLVVGDRFYKGSGKNEFVKHLERRAASLGERVVFTGYVDHHKTPSFYGVADMVVAPSLRSEGCSMVVLESMATGLPVIGSRCGAIPDLVEDGVTGMLVDQKDANGLADCIVTLLKDTTKRRAFGKEARNRMVANYTTRMRLAHVQRFYQSLTRQGLATGANQQIPENGGKMEG